MGIKMGTPYFEIKNFCKHHNIHVYSSNYTLYADMSSRVMQTLSSFATRQEVYSIDESFLDLSGYPNLSEHAQLMRKTIKQYTGIPVGIGIGNTKVMAKFANFLAKKYLQLNGVCNLIELGTERTSKAMQLTPVDELWDVGRKLAIQLKQMGIKTIYDLKIANAKILSKRFTVNLERIILGANQHSPLK
jgi:DNA polymerase V